jgi:hypothetical protein
LEHYSSPYKSTYTYKEILAEEILDFDVEVSDTTTIENSTIDFFFSNNKMSYLLDSIITNNSNSISKYDYLTFLESEYLNSDIKLTEKLLNNISYLGVVNIDEKYYEYDSYSEDLLIKKYFLLSALKNK